MENHWHYGKSYETNHLQVIKKYHCHEDVSSGKLTVCYGKITMFKNGKPSRNGPLSIAMEAIDHQETCNKNMVNFTIHTSFITIHPCVYFLGKSNGISHHGHHEEAHISTGSLLPSRDATVKKPPPACSSTGFRCSVPEDLQLRIGFLHFGALRKEIGTWTYPNMVQKGARWSPDTISSYP